MKAKQIYCLINVTQFWYQEIRDVESNYFLLQFITVRNEIVKVMFLHVSVILFASVHAGMPPPPDQAHPPGTRHTPRSRHPQAADIPPGADIPRADTPWEQTPPPPLSPGSRHPPKRLLLRTVRILLECILVLNWYCIFHLKVTIGN